VKQVVANLCGGMGNQMFQYAAAYALARQNSVPLTLDLTWFEAVAGSAGGGVTARKYALSPFALPVSLVSSTPARLPSRFERAWRRIFPARAQAHVYSEPAFTYDAALFERTVPVTLDGYFQSYRYFEAVAQDIRDQFSTPRALSEASRAMLDKIRSVDAVCIHVRRGDYVTDAAANAFHGLCGLDYYQRGLAYLESQASAQRECFVFSDDPQWVRENMILPLPMTVVDINGPDAAHEDLWLMAACRDFVIANSSMSWWGSWLGAHPEKQVIAPLKWFQDDRHDTRDLIPQDWVRL